MKRCRTSKQTKIQNDHQKSNSKFMRKHEKTNKNRIKLLKDICQKYKLNTSDSNLSTKVFKRRIVCLNAQKICYCPVAKTGTMTWMYNFLVKI